LCTKQWQASRSSGSLASVGPECAFLPGESLTLKSRSPSSGTCRYRKTGDENYERMPLCIAIHQEDSTSGRLHIPNPPPRRSACFYVMFGPSFRTQRPPARLAQAVFSCRFPRMVSNVLTCMPRCSAPMSSQGNLHKKKVTSEE